MIINHNCCIKLVPLVIFIYDARSNIHQISKFCIIVFVLICVVINTVEQWFCLKCWLLKFLNLFRSAFFYVSVSFDIHLCVHLTLIKQAARYNITVKEMLVRDQIQCAQEVCLICRAFILLRLDIFD